MVFNVPDTIPQSHARSGQSWRRSTTSNVAPFHRPLLRKVNHLRHCIEAVYPSNDTRLSEPMGKGAVSATKIEHVRALQRVNTEHLCHDFKTQPLRAG